MNEGQRTTRSWVLPVVLGVFVVALVVVALTRDSAQLDPDTPEGAVQEYLLALHEERWEDAIAVIHPQWLGDCVASDLEAVADPEFTAELTDDVSGELGGFAPVRETFEEIGADASTEDLPGSDTRVEVMISHEEGGAFGSSWNEYVVFELVDEDDFWWIGGDPWPYFTWSCRT